MTVKISIWLFIKFDYFQYIGKNIVLNTFKTDNIFLKIRIWMEKWAFFVFQTLLYFVS